MKPLQQIIEEEETRLFDHIKHLEHGITEWNGINVWEASEMDKHAELITQAMTKSALAVLSEIERRLNNWGVAINAKEEFIDEVSLIKQLSEELKTLKSQLTKGNE